MSGVLIDSNVIIDVLTENKEWFAWSAGQIEQLAESHQLYINPVIYTEVSIPFVQIEDLRSLMTVFVNSPLTEEICFLAGKVFQKYRKNGGDKKLPLPDFFIGAHAAIQELKLVTRDMNRYQHYFPTVDLISPS